MTTVAAEGFGATQELMEFFSSGDNTFECPNCLAKEHQCYYCKEEGKEQQDVFK